MSIIEALDNVLCKYCSATNISCEEPSLDLNAISSSLEYTGLSNDAVSDETALVSEAAFSTDTAIDFSAASIVALAVLPPGKSLKLKQ